MAARVLSIGNDLVLLKTRCAVLKSAGYEAQIVMSFNADELLQAERFDLVILSMLLTDGEKAHFKQVMGDKTKVLGLENFAPAAELLQEVERQLAAN